jgi:hypothetical protein
MSPRILRSIAFVAGRARSRAILVRAVLRVCRARDWYAGNYFQFDPQVFLLFSRRDE